MRLHPWFGTHTAMGTVTLGVLLLTMTLGVAADILVSPSLVTLAFFGWIASMMLITTMGRSHFWRVVPYAWEAARVPCPVRELKGRIEMMVPNAAFEVERLGPDPILLVSARDKVTGEWLRRVPVMVWDILPDGTTVIVPPPT